MFLTPYCLGHLVKTRQLGDVPSPLSNVVEVSIFQGLS